MESRRAIFRLPPPASGSAGAANDDKLRVFISDELLPCLIRLIDDQLPCAIRCLVHKLNSSASNDAIKDIVVLCEEAYNYLSSHIYAQSQARTYDLLFFAMLNIMLLVLSSVK